MSSPAIRQSASAHGHGSAKASFSSTPTAGDLLVAVVSSPAASVHPATDAWSLRSTKTVSTGGTEITVSIWYATATQMSSGQHTTPFVGPHAKFYSSGTYGIDVLALDIRTAKRIARIDLVTGSTAPSLTPSSGAGELLLCAFADYGFVTTPVNVPVGMTLVASTVYTGLGLMVCKLSLSSTTPTGSKAARTVPSGAALLLAGSILVTTNTAPYAPTGVTIPSTVVRTQVTRLSWTFSDPDPGDTQSKFEARWRKTGTTGRTYHTQETTTDAWTVPALTWSTGTWELQVRTADALGAWGSWSSSVLFVAVTEPTGPTITAPANGSTVTTPATTVTWSASAQTAYQVRRVADATGTPDTTTVYWTSGELTSTTTRSVAVTFTTNGRYEHVRVRVKATGVWSTWADARVHVSYTAPAAPTVTITPQSESASIRVSHTNPTPGTGEPTVVSMNVHRSETTVATTEIRIGTGIAPGATFIDYLPASGVTYTYRVEAVGSNGSTSSTSAS